MKSSKLFSFEFPKIKSNFYNSIQHSFDYSLSLRNLFFIINDKNKWDLPRNNYNFKITKNENLTFHLLPLNKNREKTHAQNNLIFNKKCYYSINNQSDPDKDKIQASNREKKNHNKKAKTADESFIKSLKSKIKQYGLKGIIIYGIIDCIVLTLLFVSLYMQIIPINHQKVQNVVNVEEIKKKYGANQVNLVVTLALNQCLKPLRVMLVLLILTRTYRKH